MPRPPLFLPGPCTVELTIRTVAGRPLFRPVPGLREAIEGVIGRALRLYPVDLHIYNFLSNHQHMELSAGDADVITAFRCHVDSNTARVAKDMTGWTGSVWEKPCPPILILDDEAAVARFMYILANGVKEGLVASPLDWPGASAARALVVDGRVDASWMARPRGRARTLAKREPVPFTLAPLPCWRELSVEERAARVVELCAHVSATARRAREGRPVLGPAALAAEDPFEPRELERRSAPVAFATDPTVRAEFHARREAFLQEYRRSAISFREGRRAVPFPAGAILPSRGFER
jgi:hypothetical protein